MNPCSSNPHVQGSAVLPVEEKLQSGHPGLILGLRGKAFSLPH